MIRVEPADEPESFEKNVRQPGLRALAELAGEKNLPKRKGRPRKAIADSREAIPADKFPPYWTNTLPELREAYKHICCYVSIYIEPITGAASVDHMLPKSLSWRDAYEWQNYRLACSLMNSRKNDFRDVLDPFEIGDGWFQLELVGYQVIPRVGLDPEVEQRVQATIDRLRLNDWDCLKSREDYAANYFGKDISFDYLRRRSPFLAGEIERQGRK